MLKTPSYVIKAWKILIIESNKYLMCGVLGFWG